MGAYMTLHKYDKYDNK